MDKIERERYEEFLMNKTKYENEEKKMKYNKNTSNLRKHLGLKCMHKKYLTHTLKAISSEHNL